MDHRISNHAARTQAPQAQPADTPPPVVEQVIASAPLTYDQLILLDRPPGFEHYQQQGKPVDQAGGQRSSPTIVNVSPADGEVIMIEDEDEDEPTIAQEGVQHAKVPRRDPLMENFSRGIMPQSESESTHVVACCLKENMLEGAVWALAKMHSVHKIVTITLNLAKHRLMPNDVAALSNLVRTLAGRGLPFHISINISKAFCGDAGIGEFAESLKNDNVVTAIDVSETLFSDRDAEAFAEMFKSNKTITSFVANGGKGATFGAKGAIALAKVLIKTSETNKTNETLQSISICGHDLQLEGATAFAEVLRHNCHLKSIFLGRTGLGPDAATVLAETLENANNTLKFIDLSYNKIGDEGATAFTNALAKNKGLARISLSENGISDEGAVKLFETLKSNSTLTCL